MDLTSLGHEVSYLEVQPCIALHKMFRTNSPPPTATHPKAVST